MALPVDDADTAIHFARCYYRGAVDDELYQRTGPDLFALAMRHRHLARVRRPGTASVRVYRPESDTDGWSSSRTVLDIVTDDMPFVVDSVLMELNRHGMETAVVIHPVIFVRRDEDGALVDVLDAVHRIDGNAGRPESFLHVEATGGPHAADELEADVLRVLDDGRRAVEDWTAMRDRAAALASGIEHDRLPVGASEREEAAEYLRWMVGERFTFLGYREYELVPAKGNGVGGAVLRSVPGTGLGILRDEPTSAPRVRRLAPLHAARARQPSVLYLTKTNARSTIHRPTRLDYVGVELFDDRGVVVGERRFVGLYTSAAYNSSAFDVPVVRRKAVEVVSRAGFPRGGHSARKLVDIIESYPRDELFQITVDELYDNAMGILQLQERPRVRLFRRVDPFERYVSCLVYVPRDRYTTPVRERMGDVLVAAHDATGFDYTARITESPLARLHFVLRTTPGALPPFDHAAVEEHLASAARSWQDDLRGALDERGLAGAYAAFGDAFPVSYRDDYSIGVAVGDVERLARLAPAGDLDMALYRPAPGGARELRLKLYRTGERISLSRVLPVLEHLGATVADERPYEIAASDGVPRWIYDFGLQLSESASASIDENHERVLDALRAVWRDDTENDGLNRLVVEAGLTWREVAVLRAYRRYMRQTGSTFSQTYIERCLSARPELVRLLMALFDARFNPDRPTHDGSSREADVEALGLQVDVALELIDSLDEDRIFRGFFGLMRATMRTNFYQRDEHGDPKACVALKFDPTQLPDLPEPRPKHEIFVHSPRVEGAHLRGGDVARGGIRWSDRPEDFRTEILGLMKAQLVKNSVIVPVGAKGGFVVKHPPQSGGRDAVQQEAVACYRDFISALLDLTDNLVGGVVVPPERVVRYDGDDTYLVVAADKGTATFSDIANELAAAHGFWLGDAFASGGSAGYDHKKLGITARGAWESVTRHFRELGIDVLSTAFSVVGIGDMSGDVFGNGMLLSRHIRLVGAFDHRHVFLDPDPDPEVSYGERRRLFGLPRSSWDDYDRSKLSRGGGVYSRTAKSIELSPDAQELLDLRAGKVTPPQLIRAMLCSPVDLLWNGGIGTYVKASAESNADVGDKANDAMRVDGDELRCRVVAEGGNLGFTQRGRVEYALAGGRIFTDAIDNSAGVDCSDHEVNLKILLDGAVHRGELTIGERNDMLGEVVDQVAAQVVHDNYAHAQALSLARVEAPSMADVDRRYIAALEQGDRLDRELEHLPTDDELADRRSHGRGLTAPEIAVVLAYTKVNLDRDLRHSTLPEEPFLSATLLEYFPRAIRERFDVDIEAHPLRREIIATGVSNTVVNRGGMSLLYRLQDETQATPAAIAHCHLTAEAIFGMPQLWAQVGALDAAVTVDAQNGMLLACRRLVERATRWLLQHRRHPLDISSTVRFFGPRVGELERHLAEVLVGADFDRLQALTGELVGQRAPVELAERIARLDALSAALDLIEVAHATSHSVRDVGAVYFALGHRLELDWLRDQIVALPRDDRWRALARSSLRTELLDHQRSIAISTLSSTGTPGLSAFDVDGLIERWMEARQSAVAHFEHLIRDVSASEAPELAVLSVAVRAVGDLATQ